MGRADAALIRARYAVLRARFTRINAVALRQISMHGLILSLDSSHWLLILIHINECMNDLQEIAKELDHIKGALSNYGFRQWFFLTTNQKTHRIDLKTTPLSPCLLWMVYPRNFKRIFKTYGVATTFKSHMTLRKLLSRLKILSLWKSAWDVCIRSNAWPNRMPTRSTDSSTAPEHPEGLSTSSARGHPDQTPRTTAQLRPEP